ncbi:MAG: efflux RND transporter periplasmic adaptor subunit [Rhodothermales bacterium]
MPEPVLSTEPQTGEATQRNGQPRAPRRRLRAWHVAGVVLLSAVGGLLLYAFWPALAGETPTDDRAPVDGVAEATARVEVVVVHPADFPLRAEATGHLAPWRRADISAEVSGLVLERPVEEGHRVNQGSLLLRLDDRDQQIERHEAEAELLDARVKYGINTRLDGAPAPSDTTRLAQARQALKQAKGAFDQGTLTPAELQEARRRFDAEQVLSGAQRGAVQAVTAGLTQAEQRLARARLALSRTRITAPFTGRIADLEVEAGQRLAAGQQVLALLEDDRMKVEVDVLEADLVRLRIGASAQVRVPALDDARFTGTIYALNPSIDPETGTGRVTVALPNPRGQLLAGLFAYVALETRHLTERLVVPADAVLVRQGRDLVFRIEQGRAQWVYVTVGARSGEAVEIVEGLSPGDTVAVAGHFALAHDAPVEIAQAHGAQAQ